MRVTLARAEDRPGWLALASQVEHLFGPMVGVPEFEEALAAALAGGGCYCVRSQDGPPGAPLAGGVALDAGANEIAWLVVDLAQRGRGVGRALLERALGTLDPTRPVRVTTFATATGPGLAARKLYDALGFRELKPGPATPAGVATVHMVRPPVVPLRRADNPPGR